MFLSGRRQQHVSEVFHRKRRYRLLLISRGSARVYMKHVGCSRSEAALLEMQFAINWISSSRSQLQSTWAKVDLRHSSLPRNDRYTHTRALIVYWPNLNSLLKPERNSSTSRLTLNSLMSPFGGKPFMKAAAFPTMFDFISARHCLNKYAQVN